MVNLHELCVTYAHNGVLNDPEIAKGMVDPAMRDAINGYSYNIRANSDFQMVFENIKRDLAPLKGLYSDVEIKRVIGQEEAWQVQIADASGERYVYRTPEQIKLDFDRHIEESRLGKDPRIDDSSPTNRLKELEEYQRTWEDFPAFGFGIRKLDDAMGGILPGEICLLTGAPGTMKTSLALSVVDDFVRRSETGLVYYASVDMSPIEITMRLLERETCKEQKELGFMRGSNPDGYRALCKEHITAKYDKRLVISGHSDDRFMTIDSLLHDCSARQPQLIVIDYLTRLKQPGQSDLDFVELAMPQILKYAHRFQASFLILSQMSRSSRADQSSGRAGGHSKGGGIIEEVAHLELELFHQSVEGDKPMVIAAITKSRRSTINQFFSLDYDGPIKRFTGDAEKMTKNTKKTAIFERANEGYFA
ncbi:hypothetical protein AGMMS50276_28590 [Synergistales bacterium]|nr:hypothetical protein AGMMS50276_28590 [Synergistales bacterium]